MQENRSDYERLSELCLRHTELQKKIDEKMQRWVYLSEIRRWENNDEKKIQASCQWPPCQVRASLEKTTVYKNGKSASAPISDAVHLTDSLGQGTFVKGSWLERCVDKNIHTHHIFLT
jgi:hypothetical protein